MTDLADLLPPTADTSWGGYKITDLADASAATDAAAYGQVLAERPALVALTQSAPQAIGNGDGTTWFPVEFDTETSDELGFHESVTNPERVTVPSGEDGLYEVSAIITLDDPTPGDDFQVRLTVDGTAVVGPLFDFGPAQGANDRSLLVPSVVVALAAAEVLQVEITHNEGSSLNTVAAGTHLTVKKVTPRV